MRSFVIATFVTFVLAASWIAAQQNSSKDQRYYCPMHPDYVAAKPGTCPICGMQLVPVEGGPSHARTQLSGWNECPSRYDPSSSAF